MTMLNEQLLQQVREGKASIEYDKIKHELSDLQTAFRAAFPNDSSRVEVYERLGELALRRAESIRMAPNFNTRTAAQNPLPSNIH